MRHDDGGISYMQETRVVLDRTAECMAADVASHHLAMAIAARFSELRTTHTLDDIRRFAGCAPSVATSARAAGSLPA